MSNSSDANIETGDGRPPWKRWWSWFGRLLGNPGGAAQVPIKIITKAPSKNVRVAVPVKADQAANRSGSWQIYSFSNNPATAPIQVVHSNKRLFGVIFQSKDGWLFWTGPKRKLFTPMGRDNIWTTPDPKIAVIVANFISSSRLPEPAAKQKSKPR